MTNTTTNSLSGTPTNSLRAWFICLVAGLFFFYEFLQMQLFNTISSGLMQSFSIDARQLGYLSATFLYGDALFLLPAGFILDRSSPRKVILATLALCIVGTFGFALTANVYIAGICHLLAGVGNAFCFLACIILCSNWFPPKHRGLVISFVVTLGMLGGVVAGAPLAYLSGLLSWQGAVLADGALGIIIFLVIYQVVEDTPSPDSVLPKQRLSFTAFIKSVFEAAKNLQNVLFGFFACALNLPIMLFGALWGNLYLTQVHLFTNHAASFATSFLFIGTIVGSPLVGWCSDKMLSRRRPMVIGALLSLLSFVPLMILPSLSLSLAMTCFFALGFFTSVQVLAYPAITECNLPQMTGIATGLASVLIMGGAAVAQTLFGWLMQRHWQAAFMHGVPLYTAADFQQAFWMIPLAFVLALFGLYFTRETL